MMVDTPQLDTLYHTKQAIMLCLQPDLKQRLMEYVYGVITEAHSTLKLVKHSENDTLITWPTEAIECVTYLL